MNESIKPGLCEIDERDKASLSCYPTPTTLLTNAIIADSENQNKRVSIKMINVVAENSRVLCLGNKGLDNNDDSRTQVVVVG
eukprot:scaffold2193_cov171-Amphora_coffeaeformis.AAC.17